MGRKSQEYLENNLIDQKLSEAFGYSELQLAKELDDAKAAAEGEDMPKAPDGELQKIIDQIEAHEPAKPPHHKSVRKMVKVLAAAAVLGVMVIGGSTWVGAKRYYTYKSRERADLDNVIVLNNNEGNLIIDGKDEEKKAYAQIEDELNIEVLELSYLPEGMILSRYEIWKRISLLEFDSGTEKLLFFQGVSDKPNSLSYGSDMEECSKIYNQYLDREISIYKNRLEDGRIEISTRIVIDSQYYLLSGVIEEKSFKEIVCGIKPYKN